MTAHEKTAAAIAAGCGGMQNIGSVSCCATRLRLRLKDLSLFNESIIGQIPEVKGILHRGDEIHVICGVNSIVYCRILQA